MTFNWCSNSIVRLFQSGISSKLLLQSTVYVLLTCYSILKEYLIVILLIHLHWINEANFSETCFLLKNGTRTCRTLERAWVINVDTKQLVHKHIKHIANACGSQGREINPKTPEHSEVKDKTPTLFRGWHWRNFNPIADLLNPRTWNHDF